MEETELPWVFTEPLESADIPYMLVGAFAAIALGVYRTTVDLDLVVCLTLEDLGRLDAAFPEDQFYRPPREALLSEFARARGGHFNLIHHTSGWKADCYPSGTDPLQAWALQNRRRIEHGERSIWVAPPELVVIKKLEFYREGGSQKHINDIRGILAVADLDFTMVELHVRQLGLSEQWALCVPPAAS